MVASAYTDEFSDAAICHRNVELGHGQRGVFISTRLMGDRFALSFEFFINVAHAFVDQAGRPAAFADLVWQQALGNVRGETSMDAWESRNLAFGRPANAQPDPTPPPPAATAAWRLLCSAARLRQRRRSAAARQPTHRAAQPTRPASTRKNAPCTSRPPSPTPSRSTCSRSRSTSTTANSASASTPCSAPQPSPPACASSPNSSHPTPATSSP